MAQSNAAQALDSFFEDWVTEVDYNVLRVAEPVAVPEPETRPERERRPEPERRVRIRTIPSARPEPGRGRDRGKILFLISAAILLIGSLLIVKQYSEVYSRKATVASLQEEIRTTQMETAGQYVSEDPLQDMNALYSYAINDLGMEEADGSNTVFITLPEQSYTQMPAGPQEQQSKVTFHWFS